jgi:alkylated DNA repair dioxygenase AlkB
MFAVCDNFITEEEARAMFAVCDNFITEEEATAIKAVEVHEYKFRARTLKRAPKAGFYRNEKVTYSWGQHTSEHEKEEKFPSWMEEIAKRVEEKYGEPVNHAIVIKYSDGYENHAPWHHDKCEELGRKTGCMKRGTGFYNISVGVPRTFQMKRSSKIFDGSIEFDEKLPHRSMLVVTARQNVEYAHCVPKEDSEGERWSLIFRTIKSDTKKRKHGSSGV